MVRKCEKKYCCVVLRQRKIVFLWYNFIFEEMVAPNCLWSLGCCQIVSVLRFLTGTSAKLKRGHVKRYAVVLSVLGASRSMTLPGPSRSINPTLPSSYNHLRFYFMKKLKLCGWRLSCRKVQAWNDHYIFNSWMMFSYFRLNCLVVKTYLPFCLAISVMKWKKVCRKTKNRWTNTARKKDLLPGLKLLLRWAYDKQEFAYVILSTRFSRCQA